MRHLMSLAVCMTAILTSLTAFAEDTDVKPEEGGEAFRMFMSRLENFSALENFWFWLIWISAMWVIYIAIQKSNDKKKAKVTLAFCGGLLVSIIVYAIGGLTMPVGLGALAIALVATLATGQLKGFSLKTLLGKDDDEQEEDSDPDNPPDPELPPGQLKCPKCGKLSPGEHCEFCPPEDPPTTKNTGMPDSIWNCDI